MAYKCVCDICGANANARDFIVPFPKRYWATGTRGRKLASFDKIEACTVHFCDQHRLALASWLKDLYDINNKV